MTSGQLIREARVQARITQAELGRRLGVRQPAIARWERGVVEPGLASTQKAVGACGLELRVEIAEIDPARLAQLRSQLALTPEQRLSQLTRTVRFIQGARSAKAVAQAA